MGVVSQGQVCTQSKAAAYGRQMMPQNKETNIYALIWMYGVDWDCLPALSAVLPSCKAAVAVRLNAKKTKCMPTPAAKTPSSDVTLMATPDMTALLICIQGTSMSSIELSKDMRFLLLSTSFATAAAAAAACQLRASDPCSSGYRHACFNSETSFLPLESKLRNAWGQSKRVST